MSIYAKTFYRTVYQNGMRTMNKDTSLIHISFLFDAMSSLALSLKAKFSLVAALEQMLQLYTLKETDDNELKVKIAAMVEKIQQLQQQGQQDIGQPELIKSCFMLTEVMFSIQRPDLQQIMFDDCMAKLQILIKSILEQLSNDILGLSNALANDQLQLVAENPQVGVIMQKLDIVGSFVRMLYRVIQKITQKKGWTKATTGVKPQPIYSAVYHNLVQN